MKYKRLFKIMSTIENIFAGIIGLLGLILICSISYTWPMFFITKSIGVVCLLFAYWELVDEEE